MSAALKPPEPALPAAHARLSVRAISKRFGDHQALADISFDIPQGQLVAVLGPSGVGKTTLCRCVSGLLAPDEGSVHVAGADVRQLRGRSRRRIAVIFQQFNLVSRLSALDNVLGGRLGHVSAWRGCLRQFTTGDRQMALECLDRVGLLDRAGQRADTLSGGQQQRVAIARALAQRPDLVVADEPIASLDPQTGSEVMALLRGICHENGVSVLCSLHQFQQATSYADRLIALVNGRLVADRPAHLFDNGLAAEVYGGARRDASLRSAQVL